MLERVQGSIVHLLLTAVLLGALLQVTWWIVAIAALLLTMIAFIEPARPISDQGFEYQASAPSWMTIASQLASNTAMAGAVYIVGAAASTLIVG